MASYLRPRRGKKATAIAQLTASAPLKRGEVFFEVPDGGTGTGAGRIKMGDGSTAYESLPYFLEPFDPDSATVGFTNSTAAESDPYTTNATHANAIVPSANLKTIFTNLKQLLLNYNSQFTKLNNDLGTLSFTQNEEGVWGYKVGGADTVIPFKSGDGDATTLYQALQYSGLVTKDMTFDEMCNVLANYFALKDINLFSTVTWAKPGSWCGTSISTSSVKIYCNSETDSGYYGYLTSSAVDITNYKYINIVGTALMSQPIESAVAYRCRVHLILDGKTTITVFESSVGSGSPQSINIKRDISGHKSLAIKLQIFQLNGHNTGTYIYLSKALITPK